MGDKSEFQKNSLFNDPDYTDAEFHKEYPTIFHLRKALIEGKKVDLRLLYLAIEHIMKHRGHFLMQGSIDKATSFNATFELFAETLHDEFDLEVRCSDLDELEKVLMSKELNLKEKTALVQELLNCDKSDKQFKAIIGLICGATSKLADVFQDEELEDSDRPSISFKKSSYDDIRSELEDILQERAEIIDIIKTMYDYGVLACMLKGGEYNGMSYLSFAKVNIYEKHAKDLELLKKIIKTYCPAEYDDFFRNVRKENNNYVSYVRTTNGNKKDKAQKIKKMEDLYKNIKKLLKLEIKKDENKIPVWYMNGAPVEDKDVLYIAEELEKETFLPSQVSSKNSVIPHQVHEMELKEILKNARSYAPFLCEKDETGKTVEDKIIQLFEFHIPYYVGPLNQNSPFSWMEKKEQGQITPWNFKEKVDLDKSAENFIRRMTNKCTYLGAEDVAPKNSLLYSKFVVLNELNNVKIKGEKLSCELKQAIYHDLFEQNKKVSGAKFLSYLKKNGYDVQKEDLSGFDENFKGSLSSYISLKNVFGEKIDNMLPVMENLVLWNTLYNNDKKMLGRVIRNNYSEAVITDEELQRVCHLKFRGWGTMSKEFLMLKGKNVETKKEYTLIDALYETSDNLMQLLSGKYTFLENIAKKNQEALGSLEDFNAQEYIANLNVSPALKRPIVQAVRMAEEVRKIMGEDPDKIFLEVAREHEKTPKNKPSRKAKLLALYKNSNLKDKKKWIEEIEIRPESDFRNRYLYLYYLQVGRCIYSGEKIDLAKLSDHSVYDKDHIYPQSKTKDDSFDNLVLVKREINGDKDADIVSSTIQKKMMPMWKMLLANGFITKEKFNRLTRTTPLTQEELAGFISRQLVTTRQSAKILANILQKLYPNMTIVYVKASLVSEFRNETLKSVKVRDMNDMHHAKDAYLNIVVGNTYHEKFTNNPLRWLNKKRKYNLARMYEFDVIKGGNAVWKAGEDGTIVTVRKMMSKNNVMCTWMTRCDEDGQLFNLQTVKKDANASIAVKSGMDPLKYGGYKSKATAYFILVESEDKNGEKSKSIEAVPIYLINELKRDPNELLNYCKNDLGLVNPKVLISKLAKNTKIVIDGFPLLLRGMTVNRLALQSAAQLVLPDEDAGYLKKICKYVLRNTQYKSKDRNMLPIAEEDGITKEENLALYDMFYEKHANAIFKKRPNPQFALLGDNRSIFENLSVEQQCVVLNEILHLFQHGNVLSNLEAIGGSKNSGALTINKTLPNDKHVCFMFQSVTGFFSDEYVVSSF